MPITTWKSLWAVAALAGLLLVPCMLFAAEMTARDIIRQVDERPTPKSLAAQFTMVLQNDRKEKRTRKVELSAKEDEAGLSRSLVRFLEPADVKGTAFLVLEQAAGDDVQVLYLPALKKTRRIASSQKSQSFLGTDFSYEDMSSSDIDVDGDHTLLGSEAIDGQDCWIVESIPKPEKNSSYSKVKNWIRKDNYVPIKVEFHDKKGALLKVLEVRTVEKVGEYWFITQSSMHNVQKDHRTFLMTPKENIRVDADLSDEVFTERAMLTQ